MKRTLSEYCLYLILLLLPTYLVRFTISGVPLTVLECLIIISFIVLCIEYRGKISVGRWKYAMGALALIGAVAVITSQYTIAALGLYKAYIIEPILVGIMVLTLKPRVEHILLALSGTIGYIGIFSIAQYFTGYSIPAPWNVPGPEFRVTSVFDYPNAVGLFCAPVVAMLIAHSLLITKYRPAYIISVVFGVISIVLSRSTGAVMAVAVATIISFYLTGWRKLSVLSVFICVISVSIIPPLRETILFQDNSGEVRLALWQGTANLLAHHPWFGAGLAGFPELYQQYKLDRHTELLLYPHNIFLDFWVELGLAGLIWLITVLYFVLKKIWLSRRDAINRISTRVQLAGIIAILVYGLVDVPYFKNDLAVLFWLIVTL